MNVTVLTCNGWSAVYDASGNRQGVFNAMSVSTMLRGLGLQVTERAVRSNPDFSDFPAVLS